MKKLNLFLVSAVALATLCVGMSSCWGGSGSSNSSNRSSSSSSGGSAFVGTWEGERRIVFSNGDSETISYTIYSDGSGLDSSREYRRGFPTRTRSGRFSWEYRTESFANVVTEFIKIRYRNGTSESITLDGNFYTDEYHHGLDPFCKLKKIK